MADLPWNGLVRAVRSVKMAILPLDKLIMICYCSVMANGANRMVQFEARIWEKAEHWYFYATVEAKDETEACKRFVKDYNRREYSISDVRPK